VTKRTEDMGNSLLKTAAGGFSCCPHLTRTVLAVKGSLRRLLAKTVTHVLGLICYLCRRQNKGYAFRRGLIRQARGMCQKLFQHHLTVTGIIDCLLDKRSQQSDRHRLGILAEVKLIVIRHRLRAAVLALSQSRRHRRSFRR